MQHTHTQCNTHTHTLGQSHTAPSSCSSSAKASVVRPPSCTDSAAYQMRRRIEPLGLKLRTGSTLNKRSSSASRPRRTPFISWPGTLPDRWVWPLAGARGLPMGAHARTRQSMHGRCKLSVKESVKDTPQKEQNVTVDTTAQCLPSGTFFVYATVGETVQYQYSTITVTSHLRLLINTVPRQYYLYCILTSLLDHCSRK